MQATRWKPQSRYPNSAVPPGLRDWLLDTASLTLRLQHLCPGRFRVRLLSQTWGRPLGHEARLLEMKPGMLALIRQVQLLCGERAWVYARTVIPVPSLSGRTQRLAHLGSRPLGGMLFADPNLQRGRIELARLVTGQAMHSAATSHLGHCPDEIWGRRTVFRFDDRPLLVSEVFLPEFPAERIQRPRFPGR